MALGRFLNLENNVNNVYSVCLREFMPSIYEKLHRLETFYLIIFLYDSTIYSFLITDKVVEEEYRDVLEGLKNISPNDKSKIINRLGNAKYYRKIDDDYIRIYNTSVLLIEHTLSNDVPSFYGVVLDSVKREEFNKIGLHGRWFLRKGIFQPHLLFKDYNQSCLTSPLISFLVDAGEFSLHIIQNIPHPIYVSDRVIKYYIGMFPHITCRSSNFLEKLLSKRLVYEDGENRLAVLSSQIFPYSLSFLSYSKYIYSMISSEMINVAGKLYSLKDIDETLRNINIYSYSSDSIFICRDSIFDYLIKGSYIDSLDNYIRVSFRLLT